MCSGGEKGTSELLVTWQDPHLTLPPPSTHSTICFESLRSHVTGSPVSQLQLLRRRFEHSGLTWGVSLSISSCRGREGSGLRPQ